MEFFKVDNEHIVPIAFLKQQRCQSYSYLQKTRSRYSSQEKEDKKNFDKKSFPTTFEYGTLLYL